MIKTLKDIEPNSPDFDKRQQDFVNQALCLKGCQYPHIVEVYELIKEGQRWGILMEYIPGETLAHCRILSEDVYALAATLYKLVTGTPPTSSVSRIIGSTLTPPQELNPSKLLRI